MTDNEIILGLKCLSNEDEILCKDCEFRDMDRGFACKKNVSKAAIDLINRQKAQILELQGNLKFVRGTVERLLELSDEQKAEIEELEAEIDKQYEQAKADVLGNMADGGTSCHWCIAQHRAEAIKEFAEVFARELSGIPQHHFTLEFVLFVLESSVKEKTEETP